MAGSTDLASIRVSGGRRVRCGSNSSSPIYYNIRRLFRLSRKKLHPSGEMSSGAEEARFYFPYDVSVALSPRPHPTPPEFTSTMGKVLYKRKLSGGEAATSPFLRQESFLVNFVFFFLFYQYIKVFVSVIKLPSHKFVSVAPGVREAVDEKKNFSSDRTDRAK